MERQERGICSSRAESPPPPYSSLYPDFSEELENVTSRNPVGVGGDLGHGRCIGNRGDFHPSGHQFVIVDKKSLKKAEKNEGKTKSKKHESFEPIDIYPENHRIVSNFQLAHPGHRSATMVPRQEWGTTFIGNDNFKSPKFVEYALLSPISRFDVYKSIDEFYASQGLDYSRCLPYFEIKDIKILYMHQYTLVTVCEKRSPGAKTFGGSKTTSVAILNSPSTSKHIAKSPHHSHTTEAPDSSRASLCSRCFNLPKASRNSLKELEVKRHGSELRLCRNCNGPVKVQSHHPATAERTIIADNYYSPISTCEKPYKPPKVPEEFLKRCKGLVVYESPPCTGRVVPVTRNEILNEKIIDASNKLVKRHNEISLGGRIIDQRQSSSVIPVYQVLCKGKFNLWILGTNLQYFDARSHTRRGHS